MDSSLLKQLTQLLTVRGLVKPGDEADAREYVLAEFHRRGYTTLKSVDEITDGQAAEFILELETSSPRRRPQVVADEPRRRFAILWPSVWLGIAAVVAILVAVNMPSNWMPPNWFSGGPTPEQKKIAAIEKKMGDLGFTLNSVRTTLEGFEYIKDGKKQLVPGVDSRARDAYYAIFVGDESGDNFFDRFRRLEAKAGLKAKMTEEEEAKAGLVVKPEPEKKDDKTEAPAAPSQAQTPSQPPAAVQAPAQVTPAPEPAQPDKAAEERAARLNALKAIK